SMRAACDRTIHDMLSLDKNRVGNRGSHRYSFGSASKTGHMMHEPEWTALIDLPTVTPILTAIFDSSDYIARGGGGDFCLPGATEYQQLHYDISDRTTLGGREFGTFFDPRRPYQFARPAVPVRLLQLFDGGLYGHERPDTANPRHPKQSCADSAFG
ncbi:MAG: hypothetical protein ACJ0Q8_07170, partial [Candidatus Azotimanducaceae bacterium]